MNQPLHSINHHPPLTSHYLPLTSHSPAVVTDVSEEPRGQEYVALVIGVLVAVIILLVSAILLIVWRSRRQKAGTISHDIFTGPYGEKRDIVNLKVNRDSRERGLRGTYSPVLLC